MKACIYAFKNNSMEAAIYLLYCTGLYVFITMGQYGGIDLFIIIRLGIYALYTYYNGFIFKEQCTKVT
jgi:hypothetical protein